MVEATFTLFSGETIRVVVADWDELSARMEEMTNIETVDARRIQLKDLRQGREKLRL